MTREDLNDRLDGWKEIAKYIRRTPRTAQRWERQYRLPVHRVAATGGEVVYALRSEIDEWTRRNENLPDTDSVAVAETEREVAAAAATTPVLPQPIDWHVPYVLLQASLFGFLVAEGLVAEMSYRFDRDGTLAVRLAPLVFLWSATSVVVSCLVDVRFVRARRPEGLFASLAVFLFTMALMLVTLLPWLPSDATIQASFQTRTVQSGYLKNALYYFVPVIVVFVLPTFHAIVSLERTLADDARAGVAGTRGNPTSTSIPGALIPRVAHLTILIVACTLWAVATTNYLLDRLVDGQYANLFSMLVEIRVAWWFVVAVTAVVWYTLRLGSIRRSVEGAATVR